MDFTSPTFLVTVGLILTALIFDFLNGFHDAANSIATVVSTRVLSPGQAVLWAAFFNFVAAFGFGVGVAKTIGTGMIDINAVDSKVIFAGLFGAIAWNIITWIFGLPTSSSHALIGGYAGSAVAKAGMGVIIASGWTKTLLFIVLSPVIGMILGVSLMTLTQWIFRGSKPSKIDKYFRKLQLISAALFSLGHGTNDAQKTMGIIAGVLFTAGYIKTFDIPFWVVLMAHAAIGLGTLSGGWRIVRTMGQKITALRPIGGFSAETAGAISIIGAAWGGIPVSTTHTIAGAIVGVGATRRVTAVKWGVTRRIIWAWIITIPAAAAIAAAAYWSIK
ncbi:MAG TPA: inorganic phosphate transporter [Pyrinomonadaceae bacterium]|nr:inorganic phosphate transporter [Pyrinomonadaceae bacterium]